MAGRDPRTTQAWAGSGQPFSGFFFHLLRFAVSRSASILRFDFLRSFSIPTSSILNLRSSHSAFALGECSTLRTSARVLRFAFGERYRSPLTGSILLFVGIYAWRSASILRLTLGRRSPLRIRRALSFFSHGEHSPLLGDLHLALDEHSLLGARWTFSVWRSTSVTVLLSRGAFSSPRGSTLVARRAFSAWRGRRSPRTRWVFGTSRSASVLHLRSAIVLLSRGALSSPWGSMLGALRAFFVWRSTGVLRFALGGRSTFHARQAFYICDRRSFSFHGEHSPLLGDLRLALCGRSPLGARREFSAWHLTGVLHFTLDERSTFAIGDRSPFTGSILLSLGIYAWRSMGVLQLALDERSLLGTRQAFYTSRSASILHLRSAIVLLSWGAFSSPWGSTLGALQVFFAWRSVGVLRFALGGRSTLHARRAFYIAIGDRSLFTGSILFSLGIYAWRSAGVLRLALSGRPPLGARRVFYTLRSASTLHLRSAIVLLSWGLFSSPWGSPLGAQRAFSSARGRSPLGTRQVFYTSRSQRVEGSPARGQPASARGGASVFCLP
ncbi:hypothetical protein CCACVL1_15229 [Corchorus capsularis]|uniref:Uncharacterized protein n=1 Tax=Corchorus capsularis TaxID=210143 RepID=A0A1R3I3B9_COCAP|nr:hypothetical protein CCACVL1_15229 [Corchorus capsularis]